jgi:hypothetical protein
MQRMNTRLAAGADLSPSLWFTLGGTVETNDTVDRSSAAFYAELL